MSENTLFPPSLIPNLPADRNRTEYIASWLKQLEACAPETAKTWQQREDQSSITDMLAMMHAYSPHLVRLLEHAPELLLMEADNAFATVQQEMASSLHRFNTSSEAMPFLRRQKNRISLLTALADITGKWDLKQVTTALSQFAQQAVQIALHTVLNEAIRSKQLSLKDDQHCGITVLGMGKLGAEELNYSSDIDLIIFYDPEKMVYSGRQSLPFLMNRLVQDIVTILQERTRDGYVFRTDLRLRPDPASTPLAVPLQSAINYYERSGQNWERAAMIKARHIAGDERLGNHFLKAIHPFIWRRHLDFVAVEDILSIKRQMHGNREDTISIPGHNIKTGRGGIREIEFLGQINQLIWGGRHPELRLRGTIEVLAGLTETEKLSEQAFHELKDCYLWLRTVEHRLQMQEDQQTQTLPESMEEIETLAAFLGMGSADQFIGQMQSILHTVQGHYIAAFQKATPLGGHGKLVFTGVDHDQRTLATLQEMGFRSSETISSTVQQWHKGTYRATRSQRSRELLTELTPGLLEALSYTAHPNAAFARFDAFLSNLPGGIQIFALFQSNPQLLHLLAQIMGSAPGLAEILSKNPELLYAVLVGDFFGELPDASVLAEELREQLSHARHEEDRLAITHRFRNEKEFQAGVQLLHHMIPPAETGAFLSSLAETLLGDICTTTLRLFEEEYGMIQGGQFAVLALGRLGSRELTFGSDLDLMFLYDGEVQITSDISLDLTAYYNRLAQRIIGQLHARTGLGRLYEVDTRLRPFGKDGPVAVSTTAFEKYYQESAWVFERLALTRARIVWTSSGQTDLFETLIRIQLAFPIAPDILRQGVREIRTKTEASYMTLNPWDIKYVRGGLMDLDFIIQYLALLHADVISAFLPSHTQGLLDLLQEHHCMDTEIYDSLYAARELLNRILCYLRLSGDGTLDEKTAPLGLQRLLVQACNAQDFASLADRLRSREQQVYNIYRSVIEEER